MALSKYFFFIPFLFAAFIANAQENVQQLVLEEAIRKSMEQNRQISLARSDEKIADARYKQTEAFWLPQVNLSYSGYTTNQPLNAFGFKLQQAQVQQADFNPSVLNGPGATSNVMTQLSVQQPLVNTDLSYLRKAALRQSEVYTYQTQRTSEAVVMQVTNTYLQLEYSYEVVKVLVEALKTVQEIHRFTNDRYQQGLMQRSDLLNVEVQVKTAETNLAEAKSQITEISDQLNLLMNTPNGTVYTTVPVLLQIPQTGSDTVSANRADIKAMMTAVDAYDLSIKSTKMQLMPRLNGFANYQLNDKKMFGFGANAYMAGFQLSWDIFKGNQVKNKTAAQVLEKNKLLEQVQEQMEKSTVEIRKTKTQLANSRYRIEQQTKAVEQATESLRIVQNRYSQGLVNTTDVLMAQTQLAQQKMGKAQALFMQKSTLTYLQFLTASK